MTGNVENLLEEARPEAATATKGSGFARNGERRTAGPLVAPPCPRVPVVATPPARLEGLLQGLTKQPRPTAGDAGGSGCHFFFPESETEGKKKQDIGASSSCALEQILAMKKEREKRK